MKTLSPSDNDDDRKRQTIASGYSPDVLKQNISLQNPMGIQ